MNLLCVFAIVKLVSPINDTEVRLIDTEIERVMSLPTYENRLKALRGVRSKHSWRESLPVVFTWTADKADGKVFELSVGKDADRMTRRGVRFESLPTNGEGRVVCRYLLPCANLETGASYVWSVRARDRRDKPVVGRFKTHDLAPRWIALEGRVHNIRDLGGRRTVDGCRVRQGLVYRGEGLNDNRLIGKMAGPNRLTVEDQRYLTGTLGIKTDLDLRSTTEVGDLAESPMGKGVRFIHNPSRAYKGIFEAEGMAAIRRSFAVLADRSNYPIYFHCIGGADRTGSLAYLLNGVLGVSEHDAETDWELTFYPRRLPELTSEYTGVDYWRREGHFREGLEKYGSKTSSWQQLVVEYLMACGVTKDELDSIRRILLEKGAENAD